MKSSTSTAFSTSGATCANVRSRISELQRGTQMSVEDPRNIGLVCKHEAPQPNSKFSQKNPEFFIGKFVKKGFHGNKPDEDLIEHMWVEVTEVKNGELVGKLNNDPIIVRSLKCDDIVTVKLEEIEEILE